MLVRFPTPLDHAADDRLGFGGPRTGAARDSTDPTGPIFAIKAKAHELVTHGLYSKIRNPIYVFSALFLAGMLLLVGRPRWLLILLIVVPMQIARARKEANILEAKFGDAYREYRRKTWF